MFSNIHEIVFHGKGGYDWETVYNMPIWLRRFTFNKIQSYFNEQAEEHKKATKGKGTSIDLNNPSSNPNVSPTTISPPSYVTKKSVKR
jgi:hypothetical protein|tara:strand:+ start:803 stop:1066 length:264 start_codon:yes stop_codon:yes gene_type:complete